jgi:hypothetical protein
LLLLLQSVDLVANAKAKVFAEVIEEGELGDEFVPLFLIDI